MQGAFLYCHACVKRSSGLFQSADNMAGIADEKFCRREIHVGVVRECLGRKIKKLNSNFSLESSDCSVRECLGRKIKKLNSNFSLESNDYSRGGFLYKKISKSNPVKEAS